MHNQRKPDAEPHISATDRIGTGGVAGVFATLALSVVHEPVMSVAVAVGADAPVTAWLFHFFVGTLLWGGLFGFAHDYLRGPSWVRGVIFAAGAAMIVLVGIAPFTGAGLFGLELGVAAPVIVTLFHLAYGAILGAIYGRLVDTEEARRHLAGHAPR
jgi:hypothetical protein